MKKIAIISPRLENSFSGAENYIVSLAKHLSKNNEDVLHQDQLNQVLFLN